MVFEIERKILFLNQIDEFVEQFYSGITNAMHLDLSGSQRAFVIYVCDTFAISYQPVFLKQPASFVMLLLLCLFG
jgi:hypothetical protein